MARVRFIRDFDWKPRRHVTIAYKGDREYTVRRECADAVVKAGAGEEVESPRRDEDGSPQ